MWTQVLSTHYAVVMRPANIQQIGDELAIKWEDGRESFVRLETLRRGCPCAGCKGEGDIMGNVYKNPDKPLPPQAFRIVAALHFRRGLFCYRHPGSVALARDF